MDFGDRKFKLWFYQVSHCEAIIRSPNTDLGKKFEKNIDLYFGGICAFMTSREERLCLNTTAFLSDRGAAEFYKGGR